MDKIGRDQFWFGIGAGGDLPGAGDGGRISDLCDRGSLERGAGALLGMGLPVTFKRGEAWDRILDP